MLKTVVDIILYIAGAIIFLFYCNNAFNSTKSKYVKLLFVSLGFLVLYGIYQIGINYINGIAIIIVLCLLIRFVYNSNWLTSILHSIFYLATMIAGEYLVYPLANVLFDLKDVDAHNNLHSYLFAVITSKVIHFICIMIMLFFVSKNKQEQVKDTKGFALILTVPISNIVILAFIEYISKQLNYDFKANVLWGMIALFMLMTNFLVYYNRNYIIGQAEKINALNMENKKKELDEQYLSVLEKSNNDMQILAHDFKNHLSYVRHLDSVEDIDKYIDKIYPEIEKFQQTASTGNKTLDVILSKYTSICELKAVSFKANVKNANLSQMESVDLIALLNNLLDNAVEAAEQSAAKRITLTLVKGTQFMDKLVIANSCDTAPAQSGDKLLTRKKEGALHGLGLKSVKKVCEQCGANYAWEYDSEALLFTTTVLMPKEQKSK